MSCSSQFFRHSGKASALIKKTGSLVRLGLGVVIGRGLSGRCPNCGQGKLLASYLKPVDHCADCGEAYGHLRSDDGAPWLTILLVGHIVMPLVLFAEKHASWPEWVSMTVWPSFAIALSLLVLPRAKTVFLSIIWRTQAPGSERV